MDILLRNDLNAKLLYDTDILGRTVLWFAACNGDITTAKKFITAVKQYSMRSDASEVAASSAVIDFVNKRDNERKTAIFEAAKAGLFLQSKIEN